MLPIWQAEFGLGYAALGLLRTCFSGTMAGLQIPSALLSERLGVPLVLARGTALRASAICIAGASIGFWTLVVALVIGGLGASTQHPLASALVARAFAGPRSMKALGTYNFAGDIGKMTVPAAASLLLVLMPWQPALAILGCVGLAAAGCDLLARAALAGRSRRAAGREEARRGRGRRGRSRLRLSGAAVDRRDRQRDAHGLSDLPAVHPDRRRARACRPSASR